MQFYNDLQLNVAQLKAKNTEMTPGRYRCTLVIRNMLCMLFCMAVVISYSIVFGSENSIPGVVVLLAVLSMRQADLDIKTGQGALVIPVLFAIMAIGPHIACQLSPVPAAGVNLICFLLILIFSCHNVYMFNHTTYVLGYVLLMGYDVSGELYLKRVIGLMAGGIAVSMIYYKNHRKQTFSSSAADLFKDFFKPGERTFWQIKSAVGIALAMLLGSLLGVPRVMWIGFACISMFSPVQGQIRSRVKERTAGVIAGSLIFLLLYHVLPGDPESYIGILGGIGIGFSATYGWQTVFNCFGSLGMAAGVLGVPGAVIFRIANNAAGAVYSYCFHKVYEKAAARLLK